MKTTTKILAALAVLLCTLTLTSCERVAQIAEELKGPQDTWCKYSYEKGDVKIDCYMMYSDDDYTCKKEDYDVSLPAGLTIVAVPKTAEGGASFGLENTGTYILKTFEKGKKLSDELKEDENDNVDSKASITIGSTGWTVIYNAIMPETRSNPPIMLSKEVKEYTNVTDTASVKKIIKTILISKLIEKL